MKLVQANSDPDNILTTPTDRVEDFQEARSILLTMRAAYLRNNPDLVGLAANQIGIKKAICICQINGEWVNMINPVILSSGGEQVTDTEGCGSLREPEPMHFNVTRPNEIFVTYSNEQGVKMGMKLEGFDARVTQHEVDHLNGRLISDFGTRVYPE